MNEITKISRRGFLKGTAGITGTGLVLGFTLPSSNLFGAEMGGDFAPNIYISIEKSGQINLVMPHQEMGQQTHTGLMQILAEELEAKWEDLAHTTAPGHPQYGAQNTDGSFSIKTRFIPFRQAGAAAKEMLIAAAAEIWGVPRSELYAQESMVHHKKTMKSIGYGQLVTVAKTLTVPKEPKLKDIKDFNLIGKEITSIDTSDIVQGKAVFGMDVEVPGMVYASLERSPTVTGKIKSYDKAAAMKVNGVLDVIEIAGFGTLTNNAIAVVAVHNWAAIKGRKALKAKWDAGSEPLESNVQYRSQLKAQADRSGNVLRSEGDFNGTKKSAKGYLSKYYYSPYLAHSPMEPMVALASVKGDSVEVWAPTQHPQWATLAAGGVLGHAKPEKAFAKVVIHPTLLGGAFGRKSKPDAIVEAVAVSKAVGKPVKVTWTREDEVRHGFYRAANMQKLEATIDKNGYPIGWKGTSVFPTLLKIFVPGAVDPVPLETGMGFTELPYRIPNIQLEAKGVKNDVRVGWLRSVAHTYHAWAVNNFIDELAHDAGIDPVQYRLDLLGEPRILEYKDWKKFTLPFGDQPFKTGRLSHVIDAVATQASWGRKMPKGHAQGFAGHKAFNSYLAMVFDVSIENGQARVHNVDVVVDVGLVVNPSSVKAQVEGGIVYGLTAALYGNITVENGAVQQSNFHDYTMLRINEMPKINITLVDSKEAPTGIGEPGVTPVAPALCNAIFNLTGKRIYELPISKHNFA